MIRNAVVAGAFYPGRKDSLLKEVRALIGRECGKEDAIGILSPHAGYMYSGHVAGRVFAAIKPKSTYIIMGPNHTGLGGPFGIETSSTWKTPLGEAEVDGLLSDRIKKNCKYIKDDILSHAHEHSIEVQLPFLQFLQRAFRFVPITISYASLEIYRQIGVAIAKSIKDLKLEGAVTIIASSDMTHYESQDSAQKKDQAAIDAMLELDEEKLIKRVEELGITMCGSGPAAIMIAASKSLGARSARLVKYETSGEASGDYSSVVGYAGIVIT